MTFRDGNPQERAPATQDRDHFARHHHRAFGHRYIQHPARDRGQHSALFRLLRDHLCLRLKRRDLPVQHIDRCLQGIDPLGGCHAVFQQVLTAFQVSFGIAKLCGQRRALRRKTGKLEIQLVIDDPRQFLTSLDHIALGHRQDNQSAAKPRPRRDAVPRLDRAIDRFPFGDVGQGKRCRVRQRKAGLAKGKSGGQQNKTKGGHATRVLSWHKHL